MGLRRAAGLAAVAALIALILLQAPGAGARAAAPGSLAIVRATATGRLVVLHVRIRGWKAGARWHIYVDGRYANFSTDPAVGVVRIVKPGRHSVFARFGRARSRTLRVRIRKPGGPVIAAAGDIACDPSYPNFNGGRGTADECHEAGTSALLVRARLAAVLPLGDLQYECGAAAAFQRSYDPTWGRVKSISHPAIGNHEYQTWGATDCPGGGAGYFAYFAGAGGGRSQSYYSFDLGAWHLIALNSNCNDVGGCGTGSPQERWLRADLAAHPRRCTLAYWHHPRFTSGREHKNDLMVAPLWQALSDARADVVLVGHEHNYERFAPQTPAGVADPRRGIREFVVGTGGRSHDGFVRPLPTSQRRNDNTFGALELTLLPSGYRWQFVPEAGAVFTDSGSGSCH
jgi:hypothetical protein